MPKGNSHVLQIDKCVVSRLWFTVWNILNNEINTQDDNISRDDILRFINLIQIETNSENCQQDQWIIFKILKLLGANSLAVKPELIEFVSAIKFVGKEITNGVEKELLELFDNVNDSKNVKKKVEKISKQCLKFLDRSLNIHPSITCFVVENLLCIWSEFFNDNDTELQNLYIKKLEEYLVDDKKFRKDSNDFNKIKLSSDFQSDGTLLSILSKIELSEDENNQLLVWLFPALFNKYKNQDIELSLYARKNNQYFMEWIAFRDKILLRHETPDNVENAFGIANAMFTFSDDSVKINTEELASRTIKLTRHWLLDILDICFAFLAAGRTEKMSTILSDELLNSLWPTVYFKVLENLLNNSESCFSDRDEEVSLNLSRGLRFILNKLESFFNRDKEIWDKLKSEADNQLDIVEWVLKNRKIISDKEFKKDLTIKQVLSTLLKNGALSTLNSTTDLHQGNYNEIINLLKSSEQSTATFKAYYSMLCALRAVLYSESYSSNVKKVDECLTEMKNTLKDTFPIKIRVEAMENIFSMLFLRHEDFTNSNTNSEDESEGQDSEDDTKTRDTNYKRIKSGFICNKYIIRDLINNLKNVIIDAENESFEAIGQEKCFDNVSKALADASWRLELLTSSEFVGKTGHGEDNKDDFNMSEILLTKKLNSSKTSTNKSTLYQQDDSSSSQDYNKSEIDFSSDADNVNNYVGGNRKKNWKKNVPDKSLVFYSSYSFIMNFMLSSKESLIMQCLWKCDFDKAQQVIEMFNSSDTQLDGEVRFSKSISQFRKRMKENIEVLNPVETVNEGKEISTLQNIRLAVKGGIQSSRITGQLETFLASNKAILRLINSEEVNTNEILTMTVLDLALTTGNFRSCSLNACEVALRYLKSCKIIEKSRYSAHFHKICKLFYESKIDSPLPEIICDINVPLSIQKFNERIEFWKELEKIVQIFIEARLNRGKITEDIERKDFILGQEEELDFIATFSNGEHYLSKIFNHLNILQNILPKTVDSSFDRSSFAMLELPVQSYLGYQFFELGVEPEELDVVAKSLGVDLVHSILISCCPKFLFHNKTDNLKTVENIGYVILNDCPSSDVNIAEYAPEKPNQCVADILNRLLKSIVKIYPSKSTLKLIDLQNLSKNDEIQGILRSTSCIADIDLSELSAGNETLTFFLNVWNLLFLHSLLTIWCIKTPCNRFEHFVSTTKISYKIGDLGLVTLSTLRSKLLGNLSWDLEFFKVTEDTNNEIAWLDLDLDQDPRVIFAMANEFFGTPAVCSYDPQNLDEALNRAIHNYIAYYNLIDPPIDDREVDICWLPEPVCRYQDFLLENASLARQNSGFNFDESFTLRKFLKTSVEKNFEFKYFPQVYNYELRFDYCGNENSKNRFDITRRRYSNNIRHNKNVDDNLLKYFQGHCWLLSYLVQKIHDKTQTDSAKACENAGRCACLENLLRSRWTELLKNAFGRNQALIGMHENISPRDLWTDFEYLMKKEKWKHCLNLINSLPDNLTLNDREIWSLKDKILSVLVSVQGLQNNKVMIYLRQIKNINVLASAILSNLKRWPIEACKNALTYALNHSAKAELSTNFQSQMNANLSRVTAFSKLLPHFENDLESTNITWYGISSATNKNDTFKIVRSLIDANKFELCLEWLKFHTFSTEMQTLVTEDLLIGLLENNRQDFEPASKLLEALPSNRSIKLCHKILKKLQSIPAIKFVTNYLLDRCKPAETVKYHKILISIEILSLLDCKERTAFVHLLKEPMLMFEQLLMNVKFEIFNKILKSVSDNLPKAGISLDDIDKIVRYYATKSLEFRVALQRDGIESKSKDSSSTSTETERTEFVMPLKVPTKEEWVPNDKSRVCSCCKSVVFSMFNRRHHCRRCGRVVCALCSQQRMRVLTYPDSVHVRVCDDCKRQTIFRMQHGAPSTPSSETFDYWRLTRDKTHNQTVKDEFSFEHAPSISLCLAILNLHSDGKAYASFLLDRCDEIIELLRPVSSGRANPEVDQKLLVKMIRSLVLAAKVKCAKLSLNAGLDNCDRLLSHVDLVATLVQSDCSALVPSDNLDDHALSRLRALLTEKEQWILALDVSTKSGLDRQGVWAAWGKAYLKVGCYNQAREKFAHCLEKVSADNFEDWVFLPNHTHGDKNNTGSTSVNKNKGSQRTREKTRPNKNSPLLTEILQIIESSTFNRQSRKNVNSKLFTAHDITATLNNIKSISQGRYYDIEPSSNSSDNSYYHESLHYLISYGSHSAILEFFIKHDKYEECLIHILENKIEPELFFNSVYLPCLKNGCIEKLHEALRSKDAGLITWKSYLVFTCHCLETKKYLNTLYQLQIFTKDFVRASMSCIRFYVNGATNYTDLCNRSEYLHQAQKHLETELQAQSFGPKRRKSTGSQHSGQSSSLTLELEFSDIDRHINTISRQMEIAKFLRNSEQEGRDARKFLNHLSNMENDSSKNLELPTLFGTQLQKTQLAVLAILCGRDVEEGFGIAFRIIQDYNLRSEKVYSLAGHILASEEKISSVEQLVKCCRSSGAPDTNALSDRVLAHCVKLVLNSSQMEPGSSSKDKVDSLIKLITDLELKISMCIESRQLKAAYLLAVKHSRAQDVRKIFKEADRLEQNAIKAICAKWLKQTNKY